MKTIKIKKILSQAKKAKLRNVFYNRDKWLIKELDLPKLSREEFNQVKEIWPCFDFKMKDLIFMRLYKKEHGFDPYYLCDFQYSYVLDRFNPSEQVVGLTNKAMYDVYFPNIRFPKSYLKCIRGSFFSGSMELIPSNYASEYLMNLGIDEFIIKPSMDSASGKDVKKLYLSEMKDNKNDLSDLFQQYKGNFIIQEPIKQHELLSQLNPSSLNTCRVTTVFINGRTSHSTIIKVGKKGAIVDNWNSGYYIGVNDKGKLNDYGYDGKLKKVLQADSGVFFNDITIPYYNCLIESVEFYHKQYLPQCGIVGWDTTIDADGRVIVIEANTFTPGIRGEQLCCGTIFKTHTEAICSAIK